MELRIDGETTIKEVQGQYNALYPYLQLHFIEPAISSARYTNRPGKIPAHLTIKQLKIIPFTLTVSIANKKTVAELLKDLGDLGLPAQVCRKSGNHWVETSLTSDWTLERQNREAMLISVPDDELFRGKNGRITS